MATVAHEGNPRETPALAVSGTLDGGATLILQFPPIIGASVTPPSPPTAQGAIITASCGDVFAWDQNRGDGDPFQWANPCNGDTSGQIFRQTDRSAAVTISPHGNCYGVMYRDLMVPGGSGNYYEVINLMTFLSLLEGAPRVGICLFVQNPLKDANAITVAALVTDWQAGTTGLYFWNNNSLADFSYATAYDVQSVVPTAGQDYKMVRFNGADAGDSCIVGFIEDSPNGSIAHTFGGDFSFIVDTTNVVAVGVIGVGGGAPGSVLLGGNGSTSCANNGQNISIYGEVEKFTS